MLLGAISMIIYYLMVKTHQKTGLKYLCQTTRCDYSVYQGSGLVWKRHINKHGYDVDTKIIQKCYSRTSLKSWGLFYSDLWSVVKSKQWANLRPEEGQGGWGQENNPNNVPGAKDRQRNAILGDKNPVHFSGVKEKISKSTKAAMSSLHVKQKHLAGVHCVSWKNARAKRVGKLSPNFDNTLYKFTHKDGTVEISTQYDLRLKYGFSGGSMSALIKGKAKTCHGWTLAFMK
jgi:hypothetical protein